MPTQTVNGTMKIHALTNQGEGLIKVRDTSCYCEQCYVVSGGCQIFPGKCSGWREVKLPSVSNKPKSGKAAKRVANKSSETQQRPSLFDVFETEEQ